RRRSRAKPAREMLLDLTPDPFGDAQRRGCAGARHQDDELLTAVARAYVEDAHGAPEDICHLPEHAVSNQVSLRVVEILEVVQVYHEERELVGLPALTLNLLLQTRFEIPAVEESRQAVHGGEVGQIVGAVAQLLARERQCRRHPKR